MSEEQKTQARIMDTLDALVCSVFENGAIMKRDNKEIRKLRDQGLTIRQIADKLGISTMPVQQSLRGYKQK